MTADRPPAPPAGLCARCRHVRVTQNRRGSTFYLCRRSYDDPRFPRYPPIPVVRCVGFESAPDAVPSRSDPTHEQETE